MPVIEHPHTSITYKKPDQEQAVQINTYDVTQTTSTSNDVYNNDVHFTRTTTTHTHKHVRTTHNSESDGDSGDEGDDVYFDATEFYEESVNTTTTTIGILFCVCISVSEHVRVWVCVYARACACAVGISLFNLLFRHLFVHLLHACCARTNVWFSAYTFSPPPIIAPPIVQSITQPQPHTSQPHPTTATTHYSNNVDISDNDDNNRVNNNNNNYRNVIPDEVLERRLEEVTRYVVCVRLRFLKVPTLFTIPPSPLPLSMSLLPLPLPSPSTPSSPPVSSASARVFTLPFFSPYTEKWRSCQSLDPSYGSHRST